MASELQLCAPISEQPRLTDRQLFHLKSVTPRGGTLPFVGGNEQFRRPLGGGGDVQGIGRPERPPQTSGRYPKADPAI